MTYQRVIPRDLFNEASLLKCYAKLYLNIEILNIPGVAVEHDGEPFEIEQDPYDGSIAVTNVNLTVRGDMIGLFRPLNSRQSWPLYCVVEDMHIEVFTEEGRFTPEMLDFLRGEGIHG